MEAPIFDGVRLDAKMRPALWVNRWASHWDYAFVALNGKDTGAVGLWCQERRLKYYKHLFYLIDGQGLSLALKPMNVPPFDDLTQCKGVTWRLQAFDKSSVAGGGEVPQLARQERESRQAAPNGSRMCAS